MSGEKLGRGYKSYQIFRHTTFTFQSFFFEPTGIIETKLGMNATVGSFCGLFFCSDRKSITEARNHKVPKKVFFCI